ncbi:MAG TPA: TusE/DsrC/DsvC family sulfur relay protein [Bacteroidales bacterium]|nr:TusE/DsrC/DsvC family sulfur relay protein [Bacteroidales bacterium]HPT11437.1 TusE/DsrC/DsvC family sulfur relay protein [Bacteroidales bacterium]
MIKRQYAGTEITFDKEGYFIDPSQWTKEIAIEIAHEEGLVLTEKHMEVLYYLRDKHQQGIKVSIRNINHSGIVTLKDFYSMFPGAPLRTASRLAGLPKPESCV